MLQAQQESINDLKKMIAFLLKKLNKKTKSPKTKFSSRKSKSKKKKDENSTSEHSDGNKNNFEYKNPESSSEESENSKTKDNHIKRMSVLEKHLEAIANRSELREVGVVRPYLVEWDANSYPPRFKALTLHTFNGEGSPN